MVAWVVNTVPTAGMRFFRCSSAEPHIHSCACTTTRLCAGATKRSHHSSITRPAATPNSTGSM